MSIASSTAFHPIGDIAAVDLSRHALVEASAGTGKTYTIENLVVRLLTEEPDLHLQNILLVTFTEKATSELKLRIRQKMEQTLDTEAGLSTAVRRKLGDTLDGFDDAAITTIHGFCHTLLKEFPFETGSLFQQELIDDGPLMEKLLKAQMRSDWPRRYGRRLEVLLDLASFSVDSDRFVQTVVHLVQRLSHDPTYETLIPDPADLDVDHLWQSARKTLLALKMLVGDPPGLVDDYGRLNINQRTKSAIIRDMVEPVQRALEQVDDDALPLSEFKALVAFLGGRHSSGDRNIDRLVPKKWLKTGENLHECPYLSDIRDRLEELVELFTHLSHVLTLTAVNRLREDAGAMKAMQGWISYQDMLTRVADFLAGEGADDGIRKIRQRYQVAFVDEFQDTDEVQWRIFSTLFLANGNGPGKNRLFLIGDPKQAIYAFRGADVYTYLDARQRMKTLAGEGLANLYDLRINWRSTPELVAAFNRIFIQDSWFGNRDRRGPYDIGYSPSASPPLDQLPGGLSCNPSRRPSLNVIDLTSATSHAAAKTLLAGFICREVRYLVDQAGVGMIDGNGQQRPLHFGDMAILVRSQSEFSLIEPLLIESAIPYAYYRKPGLFQCREAHWLGMVLRAICNPQQTASVKLALLTPFFDISPASLASRRELPTGHASQQLLGRWHALGLRRRWGPLFQSLMEESGLTARHCMDSGWERSQTNLQQLFDYLEASAYNQNLDMGGLVALLDSLRVSAISAGPEADIHEIEDEGDKVQILTMHVSKGLEFPVVFIAGGLTTRSNDSIQMYHRVDPAHPERGCRKVVDLTGGSGREQAAIEIEGENKRLYYVALTRARNKLYLPYYPDSRNYNWLGPICRFVSASIDQVAAESGDAPLPFGWHQAAGREGCAPETTIFASENGPENLQLPVGDLLPSQEDFRHRKLSLESFSSIGHRIGQATAVPGRQASFSLVEDLARDADEPAEPASVDSTWVNLSDLLPGGTRMGSMFHHIFENIDFEMVTDGPADILSLEHAQRVIATAMDLYRIDSRWTPQVARMVAATLRMPIHVDGADLILGRLVRGQRRHEMEFFFPLSERLSGDIKVPGCTLSDNSCGEMVIRGFIDLVFTWQGRYYIADWKSNRLAVGYHQAALAHEITAAGYELQYKLYTIATLRWLKHRLGDDFDPQHHFGGALYIFIRGAESGGQDGVFHVTPEQLLPLESLESDIHNQIAGLRW